MTSHQLTQQVKRFAVIVDIYALYSDIAIARVLNFPKSFVSVQARSKAVQKECQVVICRPFRCSPRYADYISCNTHGFIGSE